MSQQQTIVDYPGMARARWPEYEIEGAGGIAVVFHCSKKVVLVDFVMAARQMVASMCGPACRKSENPKWHVGWWLGVRRSKPQRKRFPGWRDDD